MAGDARDEAQVPCSGKSQFEGWWVPLGALTCRIVPAIREAGTPLSFSHTVALNSAAQAPGSLGQAQRVLRGDGVRTCLPGLSLALQPALPRVPTQAPCPPPRVVTVVPTSRCFLDFVSTRQLQLAVARCPFPSLTCHIPLAFPSSFPQAAVTQFHQPGA